MCRQAILKYLNADAPEELITQTEDAQRDWTPAAARSPVISLCRRLPDRQRRSVIQFRGPFAVWVRPNEDGWLVTAKSHNWIHTDKRNAIRDAAYIARTHGVAVRVVT